jgi:hypothetical protein
VDRPLGIDVGHVLSGTARLRRVAPWGFPTAALVGGGETIALLGRMGWFRIYFGRGQRIELADSIRWTLTSMTTGGMISPVILAGDGRKVAQAGLRDGTYGINGRDYAAVLHPAEAALRFGRANRWQISDREGELATVIRSPLAVTAQRPVHLGAVLLSFALVRFGLPEESSPKMPTFRWGDR